MVRHAPLGIVRAVVLQDVEPGRFEEFACALASRLEGGPVLPTSRSWDKGRDGRSVGRGQRAFACATLRSDVDKKLQEDLGKISRSGARVERIYFFTSQLASEHTLDEIVAETVRGLFPDSVDIQPLDADKIARLAHFKQDEIWKYYPSELSDCLKELEEDDDTGKRDATALALATACHPNSAAIRDDAYTALLLAVLADGHGRTPNECARDISTRLHLASVPRNSAFAPYLQNLEGAGLVEHIDGRFQITDAGRELREEKQTIAASELLEGRSLFRSAIEESLGFTMPEDQYERIWKAIQTRLTNFFYTQGHKMVATVERFARTGAAQSSQSAAEADELPFFLDELAAAAARACTQATLAEEVDTAIRDVFRERSGQAYEWLSRVCVCFVIVCTLGLEASSGYAIQDALAGAHLILDTDVVLELLGEGEPGHESARHVVKQWPLLGGRLLLADAVAEELAHHAWIAENEYQEARGRFLATEVDRRRFVRNVFVRAFGHCVESGAARGRDWRAFISRFRGEQASDTRAVTEFLSDNYRFARLPEGDTKRPPGKSAAAYLRSKVDKSEARGRDRMIRLDKATRDARLFAAIHRYATNQQAGASSREACLLVTSSGRLRALRDKFALPTESTLSLADAAYLLTLVPGASVGVGALRSVLFDRRVLPHTDELEVLVLRAIQDSGEYTMPWARRGALLGKVRRGLAQTAKERGERRLAPDEIAQQEDEEAKTVLSSAIADALKEVAAEPRLERELQKAQERIRELEHKLDRKRKYDS